MRLTSVAIGAGWSLVYCLGVAASFVSFLIACGVGLALSAGSGTIADQPSLSVGIAVIAALGSAAIVYVPLHWRARSAASGRWYVVALGSVAVLLCAGAVLVNGILITSATWGNHAGSDYSERGQLVSDAAPAWLWWLFVLLLAFFGIAIALVRGPDGSIEGKRHYRWYFSVVFAAVPVSIGGALVSTASLVI